MYTSWMVKALDLAERNGYLTTLDPAGRMRRFLCDCGVVITARSSAVHSGRTISCGCRYAETRYRRVDPDTSYAEYFTWAEIKRRCYTSTYAGFSNYGGRGISMDARWLVGDGKRTGFRCFLADLGPKPSSSHSVERLDNDANYAPGNCIWATRKEQNRNQRRIKRYTYRGVTAGISELCERFGGDPRNVRQRLNKLGWSIDRAMSQ